MGWGIRAVDPAMAASREMELSFVVGVVMVRGFRYIDGFNDDIFGTAIEGA